MSERVALVHDQIEQGGGAERVLLALHRMFPEAPIFTAMVRAGAARWFDAGNLRTSWMQHLPAIQRWPRAYAALYPFAFAGLDLTGFDLVISSTSYFAKGVRTSPRALHVCYCHTPPNFVWRPRAYSRRRTATILGAPLRCWLKAWDRWAARQPDVFVTNGSTVAQRIQTFYRRAASIVSPPIESGWFVPHTSNDFYLVVSRLVPSKRVDLAVQVCTRLSLQLRVVGEGRALQALRRLSGPTVQFLGRVPDAALRQLYARAIAVLVPGEEDFGIVPLEAHAAGTPVIAYDGGGARESVKDGLTGVLFRPQTCAALSAAIEDAALRQWDEDAIRAAAERFEEHRFRQALIRVIEQFRGIALEPVTAAKT